MRPDDGGGREERGVGSAPSEHDIPVRRGGTSVIERRRPKQYHSSPVLYNPRPNEYITHSARPAPAHSPPMPQLPLTARPLVTRPSRRGAYEPRGVGPEQRRSAAAEGGLVVRHRLARGCADRSEPLHQFSGQSVSPTLGPRKEWFLFLGQRPPARPLSTSRVPVSSAFIPVAVTAQLRYFLVPDYMYPPHGRQKAV